METSNPGLLENTDINNKDSRSFGLIAVSEWREQNGTNIPSVEWALKTIADVDDEIDSLDKISDSDKINDLLESFNATYSNNKDLFKAAFEFRGTLSENIMKKTKEAKIRDYFKLLSRAARGLSSEKKEVPDEVLLALEQVDPDIRNSATLRVKENDSNDN